MSIEKALAILREENGVVYSEYEEAVDVIEKALADRPHGEWLFEKGDGKTCCDGWRCSFCRRVFHTNVPYFAEFLFCPNCGARMGAGDPDA